MITTRHEEYIELENKLPFRLGIQLNRNLHCLSTSANWHENLEIQICNSGNGYVLLDGEKKIFSENDIVVINSNVIHYTSTENTLTYSCLIIDSSFCKQANIDYTLLTFQNHFQNKRISQLFQELCDIYTNDSICRIAKLQKIVLDILIILREEYTTNVQNKITSKSFEIVKLSIRYIREHYMGKITLSNIAKYVLVDKYTISREFKKVTKQTVVNYIQKYRCIKAIELIRQGESITNSALKCGFQNMTFFTNVFKKQIGQLPSKYKKIHK